MAPMKDLSSVGMHLTDMLYVSYLVPAGQLAGHLPEGLEPALVDGENVFVSLVIFRGKTSAMAMVPSPRIPFDQVNIRTYVIDPVTKKPAVYFVRCGISGRLITFLYRVLSGMPVEHVPFVIEAERDYGGRYRMHTVRGDWQGPFHVSATEVLPALVELEPFPDVAAAIGYLIDPLIGFYLDRGRLKRLEVYHKPLVPRVFSADTVSFPILDRLGIVDRQGDERPHNILLVPFTPFHIYLPARRGPFRAGR